jgi:hypothetical protein
MFYLILFLILFLFTLNDFSTKKTVILTSQARIIPIIMLFIVAGLRWETGVDWIPYSNMFDRAPKLNSSNFLTQLISFDFGFRILLSIVKTFGGNIQIVFFIVSIISFSFLYKALNIYTPYNNLSVILYFCLIFFILDMSGIRQAVALNVFFYSIQYIKRKELKKYILCILLAFSFHWTALLFLPCYFFLNKRYSSIICIILFLFFISITIFKITWVSIILKLIANNINVKFFSSRILSYTQNSIYSAPKIFSFGVIMLCLIFIFLCIYRNFLEKKYSYFNIFFNIFLLQVFVYFVIFEFSEISARLRFYTFLSTIILLPYFISLFKEINGKMLCFFIIIFYGFLFARPYMLNYDDAIAYNPYQNIIVHKVIFNKKSDGRERVMIHEKKYIEARRR